MTKKIRVMSGVQPTGVIHLGNYLGAIKQWVKGQELHDNFFCVVDLHTLTLIESMSPKERALKTMEVLALYLACGIDEKQSCIFIQSDVRYLTELTWILNCVTPLGWLERMTQFKVKSKANESVGTGLLDYPVLMAADVLIYDTQVVPVGEDQKQHLELACEIARRFNNLFGETFIIPKATIPKVGARIMGLDDPSQKMSKSLASINKAHAIGLLDEEKDIKKAVMSSVTDSNNELKYDHASLGIKNLINILSALNEEDPYKISEQMAGCGYGHLKKAVFASVMEHITPIRQKYNELMHNKDHLEMIAAEGAEKANDVAAQKMKLVRAAVGIR